MDQDFLFASPLSIGRNSAIKKEHEKTFFPAVFCPHFLFGMMKNTFRVMIFWSMRQQQQLDKLKRESGERESLPLKLLPFLFRVCNIFAVPAFGVSKNLLSTGKRARLGQEMEKNASELSPALKILKKK